MQNFASLMSVEEALPATTAALPARSTPKTREPLLSRLGFDFIGGLGGKLAQKIKGLSARVHAREYKARPGGRVRETEALADQGQPAPNTVRNELTSKKFSSP